MTFLGLACLEVKISDFCIGRGLTEMCSRDEIALELQVHTVSKILGRGLVAIST